MVPTPDASFYDTAPLRTTLERLVDFEYLNAKHARRAAG
jgi:NTE family protein